MGCYFLLQGFFPTQGSNPYLLRLPNWQVASLPLGHLGNPWDRYLQILLGLMHFSIIWFNTKGYLFFFPMKFYKEENLPRELKLGDYFTLTHKDKPVTDFEASTVLLQVFLWWKDISITIKIKVRKVSSGHLFWQSSNRQSGLNRVCWLANSLSPLALALWGHHTDIFTKNCGKVSTTPVLWASRWLEFMQTTGLSIEVTQEILNDIPAPRIEGQSQSISGVLCPRSFGCWQGAPFAGCDVL